ncbi:hypothetical protein ASE31_10405 [Acidovorax sp. Root217]|nr:hypothetical protein ASE31_10405 [Acidovorax sp. Root217]
MPRKNLFTVFFGTVLGAPSPHGPQAAALQMPPTGSWSSTAAPPLLALGMHALVGPWGLQSGVAAACARR